jgi:hypothetical protein
VSIRDLRGINTETLTFRFLWNTIDFFKDQVRAKYPDTPLIPISVSPNSTLEQLLRLFVDQVTH